MPLFLRGALSSLLRRGSQRTFYSAAPAPSNVFDAAVVGGGVVGCAVLRALTLRGHSAVLLERGPDLAGSPASAGNTGIACTAADTIEGSLERKCLLEGIALNAETYRRLNIPHDPRGTLYVAWTEAELERLNLLFAKQRAAGEPVKMLGQGELQEWEPFLSPHAQGAMYVPGEVLVDPWLVPMAWAEHALQNGASIKLSCPVTAAHLSLEDDPKSPCWELNTPEGIIRAAFVVNCGGLWADHVEQLHREPPFRVRPKRGDYVVFAAPGRQLLSRPIGQVPTPEYRGVYVWQTLHGNIACGPTAEYQDSREVASASRTVIEELRQVAARTLPALAQAEVLATYSGLRPATEFSDYQISASKERRWITVGGVRSTGLTASLGVGQHTLDLVASTFGSLPKTGAASFKGASELKWTPLPDLEQIYRTFQHRKDGKVDINGRLHTVTHPLARIGYSRS